MDFWFIALIMAVLFTGLVVLVALSVAFRVAVARRRFVAKYAGILKDLRRRYNALEQTCGEKFLMPRKYMFVWTRDHAVKGFAPELITFEWFVRSKALEVMIREPKLEEIVERLFEHLESLIESAEHRATQSSKD